MIKISTQLHRTNKQTAIQTYDLTLKSVLRVTPTEFEEEGDVSTIDYKSVRRRN